MKNKKTIFVVLTLVGVLGLAGTAFAAGISTPAEIAAAVTGKTVSQVVQERAAGKTYGTIANDAGQLEQFKAQMLEQKKLILDQRVQDGKLTQAQADAIINALKNNQATCTGNGSAQIGKNYGAGFGKGTGSGLGQGSGQGKGQGEMHGNGIGNTACNGTGQDVEVSK